MASIRSENNMETVIKMLKLKKSVKELYNMTTASVDDDGYIITIGATAKTSKLSADIANTLSAIFIESYLKMRISTLVTMKSKFTKTADELSEKVKEFEHQRDNLLTKHQIFSIEGDITNNYEELIELKNHYNSNIIAISEAKTKIASLENQLSKIEKEIRVSYQMPYANTENLDLKKQELNALKQKYTVDNPKVKNLEEEVKWLEDFIHRTAKAKKNPQKVTFGLNQLRQDVNLELVNTKASCASTENSLCIIKKEISRVKLEIENLIKLKKDYETIENQIKINMDVLNNLKTLISNYNILIKSGSSDIEILQPALAPIYPEPTKKKLIVIAIGILSFITTIVVILLLEFINFTTKSEIDITKFSKLNYIGMLPDLYQIKEKDYLLANQVILTKLLSLMKNDHCKVLAFGSVSDDCGKTFIIEKFIKYLHGENNKILYIDSINETQEDIQDSVINNCIYMNKSTDSLKYNNWNDMADKLYINLDRTTLEKPLDKAKLKSTLSKLSEGYDVIILELFNYKFNKQLFLSIAECAEDMIFIAQSRASNKFTLKACAKNLTTNNPEIKCYGLINKIDKHNYKFLS